MPGHIILVMFGFLMLTSGAATLSDAATPSNPDESKSSVNGLAKSSTPSASAFSNLFNTVESEALMDYIEALPKRTVKRLLDDDQLTDFVSAYENQIFNQDTVFVSQPDYAVVHDAIAKIVTSSEISGLISLFTFNVSVPSDSIPDNIIAGSLMNVSRSNVTANSTERPEYPDYNICQGSFEVAELARANYSHLPAVKTLVRMEHVVSHPMIQIYATKLGLSRVLRHPNLLQQLKTKKNKLLNVLFLDMSMISLLETKITCYKILSDDSMMVRFRVAFGKILNAMELSAIPSYFQHISQFTARALNKSSLIVEFDYNYTLPVIEIDRENQNPCLFFNLLDSCENGGVCVGFTGVGNCRCPEGFKGTFCQSRVRPRSNKTDSVFFISRAVQIELSHSVRRAVAKTLAYFNRPLMVGGFGHEADYLRGVVFRVFDRELFDWMAEEIRFLHRVQNESLTPDEASVQLREHLARLFKNQIGGLEGQVCREISTALGKERALIKKMRKELDQAYLMLFILEVSVVLTMVLTLAVKAIQRYTKGWSSSKSAESLAVEDLEVPRCC